MSSRGFRELLRCAQSLTGRATTVGNDGAQLALRLDEVSLSRRAHHAPLLWREGLNRGTVVLGLRALLALLRA